MRLRATRSALCAAVLVLACAGTSAMAQDGATQAGAQATAADETPALDDAALAEALTLNPASLAKIGRARPLALPRLKQRKSFDVSRAGSQPDGSGTVVLKQALPDAWDNTIWDAKVGADLGVAGDTHSTYQPQRPIAASRSGGNAGAAWASIGMGNVARVDARIDPTNEQGRVAGTLKHSMPVGAHLSMTLQNSYSVTDTFGGQGASAPTGLPLVSTPQDGSTAPSQVFGAERKVKINVLSTGTSFAAAIASASDDPVTHNSFSAEQKLLGPLSVTTAVSDVGQAVVNKSIRAGFKLNW